MRFRVTRKSESKGKEYDVDKKQYKEFSEFFVRLEVVTDSGVTGFVELQHLSRLNAAAFELGREVHVDFTKAEPIAKEAVPLPESARPVAPPPPPTAEQGMASLASKQQAKK